MSISQAKVPQQCVLVHTPKSALLGDRPARTSKVLAECRRGSTDRSERLGIPYWHAPKRPYKSELARGAALNVIRNGLCET